jgi:hypothetical protein
LPGFFHFDLALIGGHGISFGILAQLNGNAVVKLLVIG